MSDHAPPPFLRSWRRLAAIGALALLVAAPGSAHAKKKDKDDDGIWQVGFETIDSFFADVDKLNRDLDAANRLLDGAKTDLNSALGLRKRTTLPKALAELNTRAEGKLGVVMKGKVPTLAASDAVPTDVQAGIDAVNGFTKKMERSMTRLADAPATASSLVKKSRTLPDDVKAEIAAGNLIDNIIKGPKAVKAVNHNVGVTKALPGKADKTVTRLDSINRSILTEFTPVGGGGKAPPAKGKK